MGEKFEKIKIRTITIAIGIPFVLFIIYQGGVFFNIVIALLAIIGTLELWNIVKNDYQPSLILGLVASLFFLFEKTLQESFFVEERIFFSLILLTIFMEHFLLKSKKISIINIAMTLFISIYIGYFLSFLIEIRSLPHGNTLLIFALFATWASDTLAYIVGINFGKRHIFPKVSPNKTLEGCIGGIIGGAICSMIFCFLLPFNLLVLFVLGLIAAVSGQTGDLFESKIKRSFNVKDSGKILPGHGGILDCMDSILFSVPTLYYCFIILNYLNIL